MWRTSRTVEGQPAVTYRYDAANRVTQVSAGAETTTFGYDAAGRRATTVLPNGVTTVTSFDAASRATAIDYSNSAGSLGNLTYSYDAAGRRTGVGGSFAATGLPQALSAATYDAANQLTQWNGQAITHDMNGNITNDGTIAFTWDARNRLSAAGAASFTYDASGRRLSRTIGGDTRNYIYDGLNIAREVGDSSTTANIVSSPLLDDTFSRQTSTGAQYFLKDVLGSTVALTAADGTVTTTYTYDPFGSTASSGGATANDAQFTGQENDGSALYFFRARYYSTKFQRFVSEDPIFPLSGINPYTYALNAPLDWIDPLGLCAASASGSERLKSGLKGLADAFLGTGKLLAAAAEASSAEVTGPFGPIAAAYTAVSGVGNLRAAYGEFKGAVTGNVKEGNAIADEAAVDTSVLGLATKLATGDQELARKAADAESIATLGLNAALKRAASVDVADAVAGAVGLTTTKSQCN